MGQLFILRDADEFSYFSLIQDIRLLYTLVRKLQFSRTILFLKTGIILIKSI